MLVIRAKQLGRDHKPGLVVAIPDHKEIILQLWYPGMKLQTGDGVDGCLAQCGLAFCWFIPLGLKRIVLQVGSGLDGGAVRRVHV